jgi:hypothetical protein
MMRRCCVPKSRRRGRESGGNKGVESPSEAAGIAIFKVEVASTGHWVLKTIRVRLWYY